MSIAQIKQLLTKERGPLIERILRKKYSELIAARHKYYETLIKPPENRETDFTTRKNLTEQQAQEVAEIIRLFRKEEQNSTTPPNNKQNNTKPQKNNNKKNGQQENIEEFIQKLQKEINKKETKAEIIGHFLKMNDIIERIELKIHEIEHEKKRPKLTIKEKWRLARLKAINKIRKARRRLRQRLL